MAVRAPHLALGDLGFDQRPRPSARHEGRDVFCLVAQVIELENEDVSLAAVDARVFEQVLAQQRAIGCPDPSSPLMYAVLDPRAIGPVILCVCPGKARATPCLPLLFASSDRRGTTERPPLPAFSAPPPEGGRGGGAIPG